MPPEAGPQGRVASVTVILSRTWSQHRHGCHPPTICLRHLTAMASEQNLATQLINSQQDWLEPVGDTLQSAISDLYESGGEAGRKVEDFFHGTWMGHPLHAAVTDVPIGAWTSAVVMDAMEQVTGRE